MGHELVAEALDELLGWVEDIATERRLVMMERHKELRAARDRAWQPGVRGDLQDFAYVEETIAREEEAHQKWYATIAAANRAMDEYEKMRRRL